MAFSVAEAYFLAMHGVQLTQWTPEVVLGMTDRRRTYAYSVMTAKKSGVSPDQRRKCDAASKAEALRLANEGHGLQLPRAG